MHGRLKVRTTEEQEERKRLEREKKLKIYQYAMSECLTQHKNLQYDKSGLKLTEEILSKNGDLQTLWNIRKTIIEKFEKENSFEEEKMIEFYANEMSITEFCLKNNPKSYGCWQHRRWCLTRSNNLGYGSKNNQLNWSHELKLCSLFLESDERNFHCWRHRTFVIETGKLPKTDELEFTYEKICSNFSNYSAWHYRSKLIESLYKQNQIDLDIFKKELNLIEQALFTDPNDQSAWIYEKWLIIEQQRSNIKELSVDIDKNIMSFKFTKELNFNKDIILLRLNGKSLKKPKNSEILSEIESPASNTWNKNISSFILNEDFDQNFMNTVREHNHLKVELCFKNSGVSNEILLERIPGTKIFNFKSKFEINDTNLGSELIKDHLNNILELSDLESENSKWCLLTSVELMSSIDLNKYKSKIFEYLDKLASEIDTYRKNFYLDLKNKICSKCVV